MSIHRNQSAGNTDFLLQVLLNVHVKDFVRKKIVQLSCGEVKTQLLKLSFDKVRRGLLKHREAIPEPLIGLQGISAVWISQSKNYVFADKVN